MPKKREKTITKPKRRQTSLKADVYNLKGEPCAKIELPREIFAAKINRQLLAQAVRIYRANKRLGTHASKTRSQVSGSTRKLYRQKGTGRARRGDIKSPILRGGGVAHGPKPRDYSLNFPQKMKRQALYGALTSKLQEGNLKIVRGLKDMKAKTKILFEILTNLKFQIHNKDKVFSLLVVIPEKLQNIILSGRNISGTDTSEARLINSYDLLSHKNILFMEEAISVLEHHFKPSNNYRQEKQVSEAKKITKVQEKSGKEKIKRTVVKETARQRKKVKPR